MRTIKTPSRLQVLVVIMQAEMEMFKQPKSIEHKSFLRKSIIAHEYEASQLNLKCPIHLLFEDKAQLN
jgi:hypothetical protein